MPCDTATVLMNTTEPDATAFFKAQSEVFGGATVYALAPAIETTAFEFAAHELDDFFFRQSKLMFNRLEGSAVFPGHLDDAVGIVRQE